MYSPLAQDASSSSGGEDGGDEALTAFYKDVVGEIQGFGTLVRVEVQ